MCFFFIFLVCRSTAILKKELIEKLMLVVKVIYCSQNYSCLCVRESGSINALDD